MYIPLPKSAILTVSILYANLTPDPIFSTLFFSFSLNPLLLFFHSVASFLLTAESFWK